MEQQIPYTAEIQRKALHLLALVVPAGMYLLGKPLSLYILTPVALLALSADVIRVRSYRFSWLVYRLFGFMMREDERPPVGGPIAINGASWVLLSATILGFIFPISIASVAFGTFMICDAAAALYGRRFGKIRWAGSTRTLEGSLAFLSTGLLIITFVPGMVFWVGAMAMLLATLAEIPSGPFNDNLRVPFVAATVLFVLERFVLMYDIRLFV